MGFIWNFRQLINDDDKTVRLWMYWTQNKKVGNMNLITKRSCSATMTHDSAKAPPDPVDE